eukprot:Nitzschia sp. Nitz4//scaffold365_size14809//13653//14177//NITZ4_008915-RA/size14809-processed-gene-0.1-mRNA-1//1//CDS//3329549292//5486//frame0
MVLNARIEIKTDKLPYKVERKMPSFLEPYFPEDRDWRNFCDSVDRRLRPFEEIKAVWMILGVVFTFLFIGIIVGIVLRVVLVDDDHTALLVTGSLCGAAFLIFTAYFFLMEALVVRPLDAMGANVTDFCHLTAEKWDTVEFQFERSSKCSVYWDADFNAWINVTSMDSVDARSP